MGIVDEFFVFFVVKNVLIFVVLVWMIWVLVNFCGLFNVFIVMVVLVVLYVFLLECIMIGCCIFVIGGNVKVVKLFGINFECVVFLIFMNMGMLVVLVGMVVFVCLNLVMFKVGIGFEFDVIVVVFIGGVFMVGGVGMVIGVVVGVFIMGVMNNGMFIFGIGIDY